MVLTLSGPLGFLEEGRDLVACFREAEAARRAHAALTASRFRCNLVTVVDGNTILGTVVADSSGNWTFTCPVLSNGTHTLAAEATNRLRHELLRNHGEWISNSSLLLASRFSLPIRWQKSPKPSECLSPQ